MSPKRPSMDYRVRQRLEQFEEVLAGAERAMVVLALKDLGVFEALAREPLPADDLAGRVGAAPHRLRAFLDAAAEAGFLRREGPRYGLVPGDQALFEGDHLLLFADLRGWYDRLGQAVEVLRTDEPLVVAGPGGEVAPEERRRFLLYLHERSRAVAGEVARILCRQPLERFADLGCGAGTYSLELLKRSPRARGVLVDRTGAGPLVEELAAADGVEDRVEFRDLDFLEEDYGEGFDLVLLSNLAHCYPEEQVAALLRDAARRLRPGGRVAVKDIEVAEDRSGPRRGVWFAVKMALFTSGGTTHPSRRVVRLMEEAGLAEDMVWGLREAPESYLAVGVRP